MLPVAPALAVSFSHGTAVEPDGPGAPVAGAGALPFFAQGTVPRSRVVVSRLKKGVVLSTKKWWPETGSVIGPSGPAVAAS